MSFPYYISCIFLLLTGSSCSGSNTRQAAVTTDSIVPVTPERTSAVNNDNIKTIHVFVALCDNKYQGIVPVPAAIGNGQDPKNNLYWGAGYGVKSYFLYKSKDWELISSVKGPSANILERLLLKHRSRNIYLLADAYDGRFIRQTTIDFLHAAAGKNEVAIEAGNTKIFFGGAANLLAYIGHDGLMDFSIDQKFEGDSTRKRETIILACYSKNFFTGHLRLTGSTPLLWTSGLMAPEAYTLHDAVHEWINKASSPQIRTAAAKAYAKYQRCSFKAAHNLLVSGF